MKFYLVVILEHNDAEDYYSERVQEAKFQKQENVLESIIF